jgi:hypothetical protein
MKYRKIEHSINFDGTAIKRDLGIVDPTRLDSDMAWERDRRARIARSSGRILSIEEHSLGIVVTYVNGNVFVKALIYVVEE